MKKKTLIFNTSAQFITTAMYFFFVYFHQSLLLTSAIGASISLIVFAIFVNVPLILMATEQLFINISLLTLLFGSLGVQSLTFTVIVEILPEKIKDIGVTVCAAIFWLLTLNLLNLADKSLLFISPVIYAIGAIFIRHLVPETKGKHRQEIV